MAAARAPPSPSRYHPRALTPARQIRADVSLHTGEATRLPQAHLSGDIHSAGSIVFYVLTGGAHAFGKNPLDQQVNIRKGRPDLRSA